MNNSIFHELCSYYLVSSSISVLENDEAREAYREIGCYNCNGINNNCMIYQNQRLNNQQIKKDNDLMGKLSGDTKHNSGSDNHLKDWHVDNQSADTDPLRNTELDSATPIDGGRLKLK